MGTISYDRTQVQAFQNELRLYGIKVSATAAWELFRKTGDRGIALDAMLLDPRPAWLVSIVGEKADPES